MSLYNHVSNKEDLLDGMIDTIFSEIELPAGEQWKTTMRQRAISIRAVMTRHPWAIGLMESRRTPGPATLRHHDAVIGCLRDAGFSIQLTAHAFSALDSYIYGFALQERSLAFGTPEETSELAKAFLLQFPIKEYPRLAELTIDRPATRLRLRRRIRVRPRPHPDGLEKNLLAARLQLEAFGMCRSARASGVPTIAEESPHRTARQRFDPVGSGRVA